MATPNKNQNQPNPTSPRPGKDAIPNQSLPPGSNLERQDERGAGTRVDEGGLPVADNSSSNGATKRSGALR